MRRQANSAARADARLKIVHEDADVLVVNKPAGLLTSTGPRERRPTLLAQVQAYLRDSDPRARCGLIHRLDRDASGLLVFSKNNAAYHALKTQFFHHTVTREYLAAVEGKPTPATGEIRSHLIERADGTVYSTRKPGQGQLAITQYEVLETAKSRSLLRIQLHTGRKHQIRVHLSERGWPIVGDRMYGKPNASSELRDAQLLLSAIALGFAHPRDGKEMKFELPRPMRFRLR